MAKAKKAKKRLSKDRVDRFVWGEKDFTVIPPPKKEK